MTTRDLSSGSAPLRIAPPRSEPWWKFGHVWLIISGPAAVVVAGFATLYLAIATPDPVVAEDYYRKGIEINKTLAERDRALLPAQQARNHAVTPGGRAP